MKHTQQNYITDKFRRITNMSRADSYFIYFYLL